MNAALDETIAFLSSEEALESLAADAYWPKWDGPWWRMVLLHELGLGDRIPESAVRAVVAAYATQYVRFFPFTLDDVPAGKDPVRDTACHCQLGTAYQLLLARGVDVDRELGWTRPWFVEYQLPDGGLNCDESVYLRAKPRSSVVSTLPALEAILAAKRPLSGKEVAFLDRGARYLIERRLVRSLSKDRVIDEAWLRPTFPRFYFYDVLRGLAWLVRWAVELGRELPWSAIEEVVAALDAGVVVGRRAWEGARTRYRDASGTWRGGEEARPARSFALLDEVSVLGAPSVVLTRSWEETRAGIERLRREGRLRR